LQLRAWVHRERQMSSGEAGGRRLRSDSTGSLGGSLGKFGERWLRRFFLSDNWSRYAAGRSLYPYLLSLRIVSAWCLCLLDYSSIFGMNRPMIDGLHPSYWHNLFEQGATRGSRTAGSDVPSFAGTTPVAPAGLHSVRLQCNDRHSPGRRDARHADRRRRRRAAGVGPRPCLLSPPARHSAPAVFGKMSRGLIYQSRTEIWIRPNS
jgi:hypothetical protein